MRNLLSLNHRTATREFLIFGCFLLLTLLMTWPWILHLRNAASDAGDPYFASWVLWWDYHQTFTDPLKLFHANIFYPYQHTLAFSEHHYGIALFMFPFFALGLKPLTVHGIATILGFTFCGYGAFRLTRTLTRSNAAGFISGIGYAFVLYRFGHLPHLVYLSSGWIPILLEALVLFIQQPTKKRAVWFGIAFFFNALSAIHWFVLTLVPLGLTAALLLSRQTQWRNRDLWRRGTVALVIAVLLLMPFFIPYIQAARIYGFARSTPEAEFFSASVMDWLVADSRSKFWRGLNASIAVGERQLFPGFVLLLLSLAAFFLVPPAERSATRHRRTRIALLALDSLMIVTAVLTVTISGYGFFKLRVFGHYLFALDSTRPTVALFFAAFIFRIAIAYPNVLVGPRRFNFFDTLLTKNRSDGFLIGMLWTIIGFLGSLGMNFVFHRALYSFIPIFRSIRVPARWSMICYLGLALLAGIGAVQLFELIRRHWPAVKPIPIFTLLAVALLIENRTAPLTLIGGQVDPDALTLRLKRTQMSGGIVELPFEEASVPTYLYTLRAADHGKPLITAVSGFLPPFPREIQSLTKMDSVPDSFLDLLESIPTSYVVVHNDLLYADSFRIHEIMRRGVELGRLRFINRFDGKSDLFAVIKIERGAATETSLPAYLVSGDETDAIAINDEAQSFVRTQYERVLSREPDPRGLRFWSDKIRQCGNSGACVKEAKTDVSKELFAAEEFHQTAHFVYFIYRRTLGRPPTYQEFAKDRLAVIAGPDLEAKKRRFVEEWVKRNDFNQRYPSSMTNAKFFDALRGVGGDLGFERERVIRELDSGLQRTELIKRVAEAASTPSEQDHAVVFLAYFVYLNREPNSEELSTWVQKLELDRGNALREIVDSLLNTPQSQ